MLNYFQLNNSNSRVWNGYNYYHLYPLTTSYEKFSILSQTIHKEYQSKVDFLYKSSSYDFHGHINTYIDSPLDLSKSSTLINGKKIIENVDPELAIKSKNGLEFEGKKHGYNHYPIDLSKAAICRRKINKNDWMNSSFSVSISDESLKVGGRRKMYCNYCPYITNHKNDLRKHMYGAHYAASNVVCPKCGITCKHKYSLNIHLYYCGKEPRFYCAYCPYKSRKRQQLQMHSLRHVQKNLTEVVPKASALFPMSISPCNQKSDALPSQKAEQQTVEKQPTFNENVMPKVSALFQLPMPPCNQNSGPPPNQKIEQKTMKKQSEFNVKECPGCGKAFKYWGHMQRHYKSCFGFSIQCKYCPYKAKDSTMLEIHVFKTHLNISPEEALIQSS